MSRAASKTHLILLPGMLCDAELFSHQTRHLSDVAAVEVGDIMRDDSVVAMARSLLESAPDRFSLAGLSLGGIVAFEVLRQAPGRVERLALLDTSARAPRRDQLESWHTFAALTAQGRFGEVAEKHLLPVQIHPDRRHDAALAKTILRMAENVGEEAFLRQLSAQEGRPESREDLANIPCPTLVVTGRQDALSSMEMHEEIASTVPDATLVVIEECGHLSSLEQPQAVTALLRYWMGEG